MLLKDHLAAFLSHIHNVEDTDMDASKDTL